MFELANVTNFIPQSIFISYYLISKKEVSKFSQING